VATGVTVDGVDISVLKGDFDTHIGGADPHNQYVRKANADTISAVHTFNPASAGAPFALGAHAQSQVITGLRADELSKSISAGTGLTGGGALTANRTLGIDLTASLTWTGNEAFQGGLTTRHILPEISDGYDLGAGDKLWRRIYASEFDTFVLKANAVSVIGGKLVVAKAEGALSVAVDNSQTSIDFGVAMTADDIILLRTLAQVEYMQVGTLVSGTTYNVTRNLDGSGANAWPAGSVWLNLGYNGTGRIELDAESTPRISIKQQGTTYNTLLGEPVRIGDLNGWDDVGTERYGIGLGNFALGNYMKYDGNVFELKGGDGGIKIDALGLGIFANSSYPNFEGRTLSFLRGDNSKIAEFYSIDYGGLANSFTQSMRDTRSGSSSTHTISVYSAVQSQIQLNAQEADGQSAGLQVGPNGVITSSSRNLNIYADKVEFTSIPTTRKFAFSSRRSGLEAFDFEGVRYGAWIGKATKIGSSFMIKDEWGGHHMTMGGSEVGESVGIRGYITYQQFASGQNHSYATVADVCAGNNWFGYGGWFRVNDLSTWTGLIGAGTTTFAHGLYVHPSTGNLTFKKYNTSGAAFEWPIGYVGTGWHCVWFQYGRWYTTVWNWAMTAFIDGTFYYYSGSDPGDIRTPVGAFTLGKMEISNLVGAVGIAVSMGYLGAIGNTVQDFYLLSKENFVSDILA
jgi:hypothetical protein